MKTKFTRNKVCSAQLTTAGAAKKVIFTQQWLRLTRPPKWT